MKNLISILFLALFAFQSNAQNDLTFDPFSPELDCANCPNGIARYDYSTGMKAGIGFGLVKEISPKIDLTTNIGYQIWRYEVSDAFGYWGYYPFESFKENKHLINISIGQRFHFINFEKASIYSSTQLNFQTYFNSYPRNFGLSIEPSIGWRKSIGEKSEFHTTVSYDQMLTSFSRVYKLHPGRVGINMGFNILLKKKTEEAELSE